MVTQSFVFLMLILNILYQIPFSCFVIHMDYHRQQVYMFHLADFIFTAHALFDATPKRLVSRLGIFRLLGKCVNHYTTPLVDVRTCNIFIMGFCPRTPRLRCWCDPSSTRSLALSVVLPYGLPLGHSELSRPEICLHVCEKRSGVNKVHFKLNDTPIMIRDSILQGCNAILTKSVQTDHLCVTSCYSIHLNERHSQTGSLTS